MEELKAGRGRPKSDGTNSTSHYTIKDPMMEPFYIKRDNYNFEVVEVSTSTRGFGGKKTEPKEVEKTLGYYTSFRAALKCISKHKFYKHEGDFKSIQSYINSWNEVKNGIEGLLDINPI